MFNNTTFDFPYMPGTGEQRKPIAGSSSLQFADSVLHSNMFPASLFGSQPPSFYDGASWLGSQSVPNTILSTYEGGNTFNLSNSFAPFPNFLQQPSETFAPLSTSSQQTLANESFNYLHPSLDHQESATSVPLPTNSLDLDVFGQFFRTQALTESPAYLSEAQEHSDFLQNSLPPYEFSSFSDGLSTPGLSISSSSSASPTSSSDPFSYFSAKPVSRPGDNKVVIKEEVESPSLPRSQTGPVRQSTKRKARSPMTSSGKFKCSRPGCSWRFSNARMCTRHEKSHGANEYFCCNQMCVSNVGKNKTGYPRPDSLRRHFLHKSKNDPCVVMARSLGYTGKKVNEEEMFRRAPENN